MKVKIFKTESNAKAAIKRNALHLMNYEIERHCSSFGTGLVVRFYTHDNEDASYIRDLGYFATVDPSRAAD